MLIKTLLTCLERLFSKLQVSNISKSNFSFLQKNQFNHVWLCLSPSLLGWEGATFSGMTASCCLMAILMPRSPPPPALHNASFVWLKGGGGRRKEEGLVDWQDI